MDTNVFIRALVKRQGTAGPILTQLRSHTYELIYSERFLEELLAKVALSKIRSKYQLNDEGVETFLALLVLRGRFVH